jgi:L-threonylcarbamoyladenylate synthase
VLEGLAGRIAAVVDGGSCAVGVESTILGLSGEAMMLRPGGVPAEALEALLGPLANGGSAVKPNAPGQLASHYAPGAAVRLNAVDMRAGEVRIGFGSGAADLNLSATGDLVEAAANLFHMLREADRLAAGQRSIAVAPVPMSGLGRAINDRLSRAAAPRSV